MNTITTVCLCGIMVFFTAIAHAQEPLDIHQNKPLIPYMVSAVLRKADTETVIKLLQSLQLQASPQAAVGPNSEGLLGLRCRHNIGHARFDASYSGQTQSTTFAIELEVIF